MNPDVQELTLVWVVGDEMFVVAVAAAAVVVAAHAAAVVAVAFAAVVVIVLIRSCVLFQSRRVDAITSGSPIWGGGIVDGVVRCGYLPPHH
jgi:hypothetical protein